MLKEAENLLFEQYHKCANIVRDDTFLTGFANEKIRHSMQVAGAGNYIVRHVNWLKNKDKSYIELVKTAVLLHDVCRFAEIIAMYNKDAKIDHGVAGAELLRTIPMFSDIRIWLPIKHHGHLIEALYDDDEYKNIADESLKEEVKQICFIVRDADKIANMRMLAYEPNIRYLFWGKASDFSDADRHVSAISKDRRYWHTTLPRLDNATAADRISCLLSWYCDINYRCSIEFCDKLKVTDVLVKFFNDICIEEDFKKAYLDNIYNFLATHEYLD